MALLRPTDLFISIVSWLLNVDTPYKLDKKREELKNNLQTTTPPSWNYKPGSLTSKSSHTKSPITTTPTTTGVVDKYIILASEKYLNLATPNFLGFSQHPKLNSAAEKCMHKFGPGTSGPPIFYGSADVYKEMGRNIAKFLQVEDCVTYNITFTAMLSAIQVYAGPGDVIFVDEQVNISIRLGLNLSKSRVIYFKANDVQHLARLLEQDETTNQKRRRFCVLEGIYSQTGTLCPLGEINDLCKRHKVRILLDESVSFGVLGPSGRGATEHFGIKATDMDVICGTFETGFASYGGFIAGSTVVGCFQRYYGNGHIFSTALPPMFTSVVTEGLKMLQDDTSNLVRLRENCELMHRELKKVNQLRICSDPISPMKYLSVKNPDISMDEASLILDGAIETLKTNHKIAVGKSSPGGRKENSQLSPSIRICVNALLQKKDVDDFVSALQQIFHD